MPPHGRPDSETGFPGIDWASPHRPGTGGRGANQRKEDRVRVDRSSIVVAGIEVARSAMPLGSGMAAAPRCTVESNAVVRPRCVRTSIGDRVPGQQVAKLGQANVDPGVIDLRIVGKRRVPVGVP